MKNVAHQKVFIVHENLKQRAISPSENVLSLNRFWKVVQTFLEWPKTLKQTTLMLQKTQPGLKAAPEKVRTPLPMPCQTLVKYNAATRMG